jgi:RNA recognition motif-containing protein
MKYFGNISQVSNCDQTARDPAGRIKLGSISCFSPGGFDMSTHIHVSGLSYFCTDDKLRQTFIPFGTVVLAQVLRDECGHSLGLGVVQMSSSEEVEHIFSAQQLFEVEGTHLDIWEPLDPDHTQIGLTFSDHIRVVKSAQERRDQFERYGAALEPNVFDPEPLR